ncbi:MAG TPA: Lpg1974 family pore-forming outer membrane protein [Gemmata sp.]
MRIRYIGGAVLAAVVAVACPERATAQDGQFQTPLNSGDVIPIPTGRAGDSGFYTSAEFVMYMMTKAIGEQPIAYRGFYDSQGAISGVPGTFIGSGAVALDTYSGGQRTYQPGFRIELGYKFDTGTQVFLKYMQLYDAHYSSGVTQNTLGFKARPDLADTFLSSPVYNFTTFFNGPNQDTNFDTTNNGGNNTAGLWNAADVMDTKFTQRYTQADLGLRTPLFSTEYSSVYGMSGARFAWFFERFSWRTVDLDQSGNSIPQSAAQYTNTLSQRMYGLFVGCGHEVYLGNMFSLSTDLTGAAFLDVAKGRAKYKLGDDSTQSKYGRNTWALVPSATADINLWMYPVEGIQLRVGYSAMTFFNTRYMKDPVGFNFGNIDPNYDTKYFRLIHGFNIGVGFFF